MIQRLSFGPSLLLFFFTIGCVSTEDMQPHIILFIADDVGWNDFGCYENPFVKTPHIDALAKNGLVFSKAYLTASSCSPSRCSVITGRYPHNTGAPELHMPLPDDQLTFPQILLGRGYHTILAGKFHMGTAVGDDFIDLRIRDNGVSGSDQWVATLRDRPMDKPFFAWFAAHDAHRAWQVSPEEQVHDPAAIAVPPYLVDDSLTRADLTAYYDEISRFDRMIGFVVDELQHQDIFENTCIMIMADNGRPFPRAKTRLVDDGIKTPFIVHWPGDLSSGLTASLISSVDIAPTILDIAGAPIPERMQGASFRDLFDDVDAKVRDFVFAEHNWHDYEAHARMICSGEYLLIKNNRPQLAWAGPADSKGGGASQSLLSAMTSGALSPSQADVFLAPRPSVELYELAPHDVYQLNNLATEEQYQHIKDGLLQELEKWVETTDDSCPEILTADHFDRATGTDRRIDGHVVRGEIVGSQKALTNTSRPGIIIE